MVRMLRSLLVVLLPTVLLALDAGTARADFYFAEAFDNATVWPSGPRPGPNGKRFCNIEGLNNGDFASYGVADFDSQAFGFERKVANINGFYVALTQSNAAFTRDGPIKFWLTADTFADIQPAKEPGVFFDTNDTGGLGKQLQPRVELGTADFLQGKSGQEDTFYFELPDDVKAYLVKVLNAGGVIRLLVTPEDDDVAATYAGFDHKSLNGPVLLLDVDLVK